MTQFQIDKTDPARTRLIEVTPEDYAASIGGGDVLVRVDRFGLSSNNITYVVLGDRFGYWKFFPAAPGQDDGGGEGADEWGVMPVWGFGDVVESRCDNVEVGERLFGYFPPATHLVMHPDPSRPSESPVLDASAHRQDLPLSYNTYERVLQEPHYDPADDNLRMLLNPLQTTAWALWQAMREAEWFAAEQVVIVSASSKTGLGLAQALKRDHTSPEIVGLTSPKNRDFIVSLDLYDRVVTYDEIEESLPLRPSVVVDMAGSGAVLGRVHRHLGQAMLRSINVGLTHWDEAGDGTDIIRERSEMFFAPGVIEERMKQLGAAEFTRQTREFLTRAFAESRGWLTIETVQGLDGMEAKYAAVRDGSLAPDRGIIVSPAQGLDAALQ
ncbi:DUF2855 family protein [Rhodococcus sp. H29-C3]|uniref:DUF2855 family protein n=1 Tax=Rhodococcus sp. H29-C3 TaxID=3046307 RepID=UPI0024BB1FA2|nr:DUF2855 family protein [Rhodococcus sp. H29-C3]MDJ0359990.1 DUF2855 family protein [Rhodococcus sp. H29-C3]